MNILESAKAYEPKSSKDVSELEVVRTDLQVEDGKGENREGKSFDYKFTVIDGIEYRIPYTVLEQLKSILVEKPELKTFKVTKSGTGMGTKYQVITLD